MTFKEIGGSLVCFSLIVMNPGFITSYITSPLLQDVKSCHHAYSLLFWL